jgi:hypothetical protein
LQKTRAHSDVLDRFIQQAMMQVLHRLDGRACADKFNKVSQLYLELVCGQFVGDLSREQ